MIQMLRIRRNAKDNRMAYKFKWTEQEDSLLRTLKEENKVQSWIMISNQINMIQSIKERTPKQCRERYINHVRICPNGPHNTMEWSQSEHSNFLNLYKIHGSKWALIARSMPGRSQIFLKNRFYSGFRKIIRKINSVQQLNKTSKKRLLKYENLLRIIQADNQFKQISSTTPQKQLFVFKLRQEILACVWNQDNLSNEEIQDLIKKIHQFNTMFSYFGMRKVKFHSHSNHLDKIDDGEYEKISEQGTRKLENDSLVAQTSEEKSSKSGQSCLWKWDEQFEDLLDIFYTTNPTQKKASNEQDLEEQLSLILKRDYIKQEQLFF